MNARTLAGLVLGALLVLAVASALLVRGRAARLERSPYARIDNGTGRGARAAYLYLAESGAAVDVLRRPYSEIPADAKVVLAAGPVLREAPRGEVAQLVDWIQKGGTFVYLVPRTGWAAFLGACRATLRPGGRLLLKEVDVRPRWKFWRCVLQETVSVKLVGLTLGGEFAFASQAEMRGVLTDAGVDAVAVTDLGRGYLTPHVLYEAVRR